MTYSSLPKVYTIEEVAEYLRVEPADVLEELERGHIGGFKVGGKWRSTEADLLRLVDKTHTGQTVSTDDGNSEVEYSAGDFTDVGPFDYQWPKKSEHFDTAFETVRAVGGRNHTFRIAMTNRHAASLLRRRTVVWLDGVPLVEFAGSNNFESDELMASIIKVHGGKQLRPAAKVPKEYAGFRLDRYNVIVEGDYASKNMAIVVTKDDYESMLRHATIRARLKGII